MEDAPRLDTPRSANWLEVLAVVATALLHLLISNVLGQQGVFIALALSGWTAYAVWRARRDWGVIARWGFTRRDLRPAFIATGLVALVAVVGMALIGRAGGSLDVDGRLPPLLLLYPLWGMVQQFLVQGLVAGNLRRTKAWMRSAWFVVPLCALLFGLVHLPGRELAAATSLMGLAFTPIYLRWRNLWPLGLFHGWLGALFYVWILGRDPWGEIVG